MGYKRRVDDPSILNARGGNGTNIGAFEFGAQIIAVSRKTHGTSDVHDIDLPLKSSALGIECRRNTGNDAPGSSNFARDHRVVVTFPLPITVSASSVTSNNAADNPTATGSVNGNVVTVDLHNIANIRLLNINLIGVSDGTNTNDVIVPMGVLLGDTTQNGSVNASDVSQTKSKSGQSTNNSNFGNDVTLSASINSSDISLVKSKSGTALP